MFVPIQCSRETKLEVTGYGGLTRMLDPVLNNFNAKIAFLATTIDDEIYELELFLMKKKISYQACFSFQAKKL